MDDRNNLVPSAATRRTFVVAVAPRPWLWPVALGALLRLAAPGWWRRWPPVPAPPPDYWRFRMETAYGGDGDDRNVTPADVVSYLEWCRTAPGRER